MDFLKPISALMGGTLLLLIFQMPVHAQIPEYQVKAAMLYKFALFVEWPIEAFSTTSSPFVVCVLGKDPFGPWLQHEVGDTQVGAHSVEIRRLEKVEAARRCHIVFISRSEEPALRHVLSQFRHTTALIVSDVSNIHEFCRDGGMIGLVMEGDKVSFELNSKAAAETGLKIDSRLKRIAKSSECGGAP